MQVKSSVESWQQSTGTPGAAIVDDRARPARWTALDVLLMSVIAVVLFIVGAILVSIAFFSITGMLSGNTTNPNELIASPVFNIGMMALQAVALFAAVSAGRAWRRVSWAAIGLEALSRRWIILSVVAAVALRVLLVPIVMLLATLGFPMDNSPQVAFLAPEGFSWSMLIWMLLLGGVAIPLTEELFFRGVLYAWLRRWGVWLATLISAGVFAAVHVNPGVMVVAFLLGLVTAYVYERSGSLWSSILVHVAVNSMGLLLLYGMLALGVALPGV